MFTLGQFFDIKESFKNIAIFGIIVGIDENDKDYLVYLYDENKKLIKSAWLCIGVLMQLTDTFY